jgi:multidrug efflux pump subunit AcrB
MPFIIISSVVLIIVAGLAAYQRLDIEAYPNPVPPLVEVITQPNGWSAEEVERYVTIPLEIGLSAMPGLDHIRSQSIFGLSDVKCYFKWGYEYKDVRQETINRSARSFATRSRVRATPSRISRRQKTGSWSASGDRSMASSTLRAMAARRRNITSKSTHFAFAARASRFSR